MRLTLSNGREIELSRAMVSAMGNTLTATGDRAWSCLDIDVALETAQALERRGLVTLSPQGPWFVTAGGLEVMDALELDTKKGDSEVPPTVDLAEASSDEIEKKPEIRPHNGVPPRRVTVHPDVPTNQVQRLQWAIRQGEQKHLVPTRLPKEYFGSPKMQLAIGVGVVVVVLGFLAWDIMLGIVAGIFCWVAVGQRYLWYRRELGIAVTQLRNNPFHVIEDHKGLYTTGEMLDREAEGMLGRAQAAVDTVLDSSLHREGLLLDEIRNRVVLADTEWWIARDLYEQAQIRQRIDSAPAVGERSRQAAERARAALAKEAARVESKIRTLESYADRVRAAELEVRDRELAAELDAIADQAEQVGAVRPQNDESLSALIQAQELALEIAAFSDDRDADGIVRQGGES